MNIVIFSCGFLFIFIMAVYLLILPSLGYKMEIDDVDIELQKINTNPNKFQISIGIALMHNICVIILTIALFIAFSPYNIILGIVWTIFRIGEGLLLSYNDKKYSRFLNLARKYSNTSGVEKKSLIDLVLSMNKTKEKRFSLAMTFWAAGTLAFSIVIVISGIVPFLISLLGIIGSISVGFGDGFKLINPDLKVSKVLSSIGGLVALLFEIILGGWLMFYSFIV